MKLLLAAGLCVTLTACNTLSDWFPGSASTDAQPVTTRETAVVIPKTTCPVFDKQVVGVRPAVLPLVAAALPLIVSTIADATKAAVTQAQSDLTATYVAYGTDPLLSASVPQKQCIIVARGKFGPLNTGIRPSNGKLDTSVLTAIGASDYPSLVSAQPGASTDWPDRVMQTA
jgi:hypothetical protein